MDKLFKIFAFLGFIALILYIAVDTSKSVIYYHALHAPSALFVFGGTCLMVLATSHYSDVTALLKRVVFSGPIDKKYETEELRRDIVDITDSYYQAGITGLMEEKKFKSKTINEILEQIEAKIPISDITSNLTRSVSKRLFEIDRSKSILTIGKMEAPAIGMFGTILGLVKLLDDLSDLSSLGPNMALALITTLYGVFVSFLLGIFIYLLEERKKNIQRNYGLVMSWLRVVEKKKPSLYLDKEKVYD